MAEGSEVGGEVEAVLAGARVIAVLGAHVQEQKPAFYVPEYLHGQGYRILPVNPAFLSEKRWGESFRRLLAEIEEPVDVVNVFRRSAAVPDHVEDILAMTPRPRWVWLQLGVRSDRAAAQLERAGVTVIQDRCLLADHRAWRAGR